MATPAILIVDDEEAISWSLQKAFERNHFHVGVAPSAEIAFELAEKLKPNAIILDIRLPGIDGLSAIKRLHEITHHAPIIIITAHGNLSTAVKAVEGGAFDYLVKPFDLNVVLEIVDRALKQKVSTNSTTSPANMKEIDSSEIIGRSVAIQAVFKRIALVAPHDANVLITGESGTGKELVARAIHQHSLRKDKPFLPVHVASLSATLVESELFGHVRGAFTGAAHSKDGLLVLADGGTVFLDEIADIPLAVQAKLLRVVEHQEVLPVGGNRPIKINVRILGATHQDLLKQVNAGQFRHDLYFRLNVFEVHLPALRDRIEDIPLLAEYFLCHQLGQTHRSLAPETIVYLQNRKWPGNVRELRNAIEHAAIVGRSETLLPSDFPPPITIHDSDTTPQKLGSLVREWVREQIQKYQGAEPENLYDELLKCIEPALLDEVLRQTGNNRLASARWLGLARATLRKLISRYRPVDDLGTETEES
jgi:two-component system, NtrC family, nitrogen regulation response regulator GlnG